MNEQSKERRSETGSCLVRTWRWWHHPPETTSTTVDVHDPLVLPLSESPCCGLTMNGDTQIYMFDALSSSAGVGGGEFVQLQAGWGLTEGSLPGFSVTPCLLSSPLSCLRPLFIAFSAFWMSSHELVCSVFTSLPHHNELMALKLWAKINPWLGCFHPVFSYSNTKPWPVRPFLCNTIKSGMLGQIVTAAVHSITPSLPARHLACHPWPTSKLPTTSSPAYLHSAHSITPRIPAWCPQCHLQPNCKALSMSPPGYLQAAYTFTAMRFLNLPAQHTVISNRKKHINGR